MRTDTSALLWLGLPLLQLAAADSINDLVAKIPVCADQCYVSQVPKVCPKGLKAFACQCDPQNQATLAAYLTPCILKACNVTTGTKVRRINEKICSLYSESIATQGYSRIVSSTTTPVSSPNTVSSSSSDPTPPATSSTQQSGTQSSRTAAAGPRQTAQNSKGDQPSSSPAASSSSRLSTGATAGICIGIALVILLATGIAFYLLRRRQQNHKSRWHSAPEEAGLRDRAELGGGGGSIGPTPEMAEAPGVFEPPPVYAHEKDSTDAAPLSPVSDGSLFSPFSPLSVRSELASEPMVREYKGRNAVELPAGKSREDLVEESDGEHATVHGEFGVW